MALNILKDKEIKEAKAKEKLYFFNDGGGLRLAVKPNGTKLWEFRFTINSKRNVTTFKTYPTVTLEQARKKRDEYQCIRRNNSDSQPIYIRTLCRS